MAVQARKTYADVRGATERTVTTKNTSTRRITTPPVPSFVPGMRKASPTVLPKSNAESIKPFGAIAPPPVAASSRSPPIHTISQAAPANQNQTFHALSSDSRQTGRRTTGNQGVPASSFRESQLYHSLSYQNVSNQSLSDSLYLGCNSRHVFNFQAGITDNYHRSKLDHLPFFDLLLIRYRTEC